MYRRLFGVPDVITDMTMSLEMVETERSTHWKAMFGHQKGSERFKHFSGVPRGYRNPPGSQWALLGLSGREEEAAKVGAPPKPNPNWEGGWPPFPSLPLPLPSSPTPTREGGNPTPTGSRTPPWARHREG